MQFRKHKTLERSRETVIQFGEHNRQLKESRETAVHKKSKEREDRTIEFGAQKHRILNLIFEKRQNI